MTYEKINLHAAKEIIIIARSTQNNRRVKGAIAKVDAFELENNHRLLDKQHTHKKPGTIF